MNKINPFFLIGTVGMLFTSMFHIIMAAITTQEAAASSYWVMYPVFAGFLLAGTVIMMRRKNPLTQ